MNPAYLGWWILGGVAIAVPLLAIASLVRSSREPASGGKRISMTVAGSVLATWLLVVVGLLAHAQPWRSGVLAHGFSPEGREYCVIQTFQDFSEPYKVSFYLRDERGIWRWHYLAHQDRAWEKVVVEFGPGGARISRDGVSRKQIPPDTDVLDLAKLGEGETYHYRPANFTVADVAAFHGRWLPRQP